VQVVQVDRLHAQAAQRPFGLAQDPLGAGVVDERVAAVGADLQTDLRGDDDLVAEAARGEGASE
jgi:hypothetical protein